MTQEQIKDDGRRKELGKCPICGEMAIIDDRECLACKAEKLEKTKPSPGALRAAKSIHLALNGIIHGWLEDKDREWIAAIIDRETGANDLLTALEQCVNGLLVCDVVNLHDPKQAWIDILTQAQAAIAKAKGEKC